MKEFKKIVLAQQFLNVSVGFEDFCDAFDVIYLDDKDELKTQIKKQINKEIALAEEKTRLMKIKKGLLNK